jgi:cyclophilin family peptidyl-prolyl cis-trans isomerase
MAFKQNNLWIVFFGLLGVVVCIFVFDIFTKKEMKKRVRFDAVAEEIDTETSARTKVALNNTSKRQKREPVYSIPDTVYLEVAKQDYLREPAVGRIVIQLFKDSLPKTTHNFAELCRTKKYVGVPFHRVIRDFMIQGGDISEKNGTGSYSIYGGEGKTFEDEGFPYGHDEAGVVSMANSGPNTNGSQFFIVMKPAPHLDGKHVAFGRVVSGMEHARSIELEVTNSEDVPIRSCYISDCGIWTPEMKEREKEEREGVSPVVSDVYPDASRFDAPSSSPSAFTAFAAAADPDPVTSTLATLSL